MRTISREGSACRWLDSQHSRAAPEFVHIAKVEQYLVLAIYHEVARKRHTCLVRRELTGALHGGIDIFEIGEVDPNQVAEQSATRA